MDLSDVLAANMGAGDETPQREPLSKDVLAVRLLDHYADLIKPIDYKVGDLVEKKPGLGGETKDNGLYIVVEFVEGRRTGTNFEKHSGTPHLDCPQAVRLGMLDGDNDFVYFGATSKIIKSTLALDPVRRPYGVSDPDYVKRRRL